MKTINLTLDAQAGRFRLVYLVNYKNDLYLCKLKVIKRLKKAKFKIDVLARFIIRTDEDINKNLNKFIIICLAEAIRRNLIDLKNVNIELKFKKININANNN